MVLAGNYGMSGAGAGALMHKTAKEGTELLNKYFKMFEGLGGAIANAKAFLKEHNYVEGLLGRRRSLPDISLPSYKPVYAKRNALEDFNPFLGCKDREPDTAALEFWSSLLGSYIIYSNVEQKYKNADFKYNEEVSKAYYNKIASLALCPPVKPKNGGKPEKGSPYAKMLQYIKNNNKLITDIKSRSISWDHRVPETDKDGKETGFKFVKAVTPIDDEFMKHIIEIANKFKIKPLTENDLPTESVVIEANTARKAQAERQCFNAIIQGAAGTLTKKAMIDIHNDPLFKKWDTHLIITVHDEVLVECPEEYADLVEKRLPLLMIKAAEGLGIINPKMKCDPYNVSRWYCDTAAATIMAEFEKLIAKGVVREEALQQVIDNHIEAPADAIIKTIETGCDLEF